MSTRVAFVTTHPIQYQIPLFRILHEKPDIDLTVFYCHQPDQDQQGDGFGVAFQWDIPLLDGYNYEFLRNVSQNPSVTAFRGCDTPEIDGRIRDGRFDAVIVNGWVVKSCLQTLRACRRHRVPCLVRGEANLLRPRPWWKHIVHGHLVRQYAACLYIGQANRDFYRRHGVPEERLFPAPYCVENSRFTSSGQGLPRAELRRQWNIPEQGLCFLFSGKLETKKHPLELLQAFRDVTAGGHPAHLLIAGDGPLHTVCEQYVRQHGLPVTFTGFLNQSRMPDAYRAADCLVLPSDHGETWGLVVNEAMCCGLPAIVSDQVGCRADLIIEGETGASFPFGDWSALTIAMSRWAREPARVREMGQAVRKHIDNYSPDVAVQGIERAIHSVAH